IDGRSDIFGDAPIRDYANAISLITDPTPMLDGNRIDHVVFWPDSRFAKWLDANPAWHRAYSDSIAAVWVRR
ncbi:MAG TPA: hypothetical protein VFM74_00905, partial [Candidatus Limnocylindria bacterium]|nr:hypothetical protein [Candidatus Limnocylindria bacterium]